MRRVGFQGPSASYRGYLTCYGSSLVTVSATLFLSVNARDMKGLQYAIGSTGTGPEEGVDMKHSVPASGHRECGTPLLFNIWRFLDIS